MAKVELTPEVVGRVIKKMGLVSHYDRRFIQEALTQIVNGGDEDTVIEVITTERHMDLYGSEGG